MTFNPQEHLISLKGKKYLQVTHRLVWFRETHPQGSIITETISLDPIVFKATILDNEGRVIGTGHGSANAKPGAVWSGREVEKAETAAIGRALATAGFGTQFAEGFDDDDYLADSPVESPQRPATTPKTGATGDKGAGAGKTAQTSLDAPSNASWWTDKDQIAYVKQVTGFTPGALLLQIGEKAQLSDFTSAEHMIEQANGA